MDKNSIKEKISDEEIGAHEITVEEIYETDNMKFINRLGLMFNAEIRGIEKVPVSERKDTSPIKYGTMWAGANFSVMALSTGALGPASFGLGWYDTVACIILTVMVASIPIAYYSAFASNYGLRQMILTRFMAGNITARIYSLLLVISAVGWSAVNQLAAVQLLHIVNNEKLPPWAGCLILSVLTTILALFGYDYIHTFDKYAWIPTVFVFFVIIARLSINDQFYNAPMPSGPVETGSCLTYISIVWAYSAGWINAGDYVVYRSPDMKSWKVFTSVYIGLVVPTLFSMLLGAACGTAALKSEKLAGYFAENSIGGLIYGIIVDDSLHGFGQFCCVLLALSAISGNIPNSYSLSIGTPAIWSQFARLPRIFWCILGNAVALGLSIPAYYVFVEAMSDFLDMVSYMVSIYIGTTIAELLIFKRYSKVDYDAEIYTVFSELPIGIAGTFAFFCGVAGAVVGMSEAWYTGPIALKADGGDVGWLLGLAFSFVAYCIARPFELKYFR